MKLDYQARNKLHKDRQQIIMWQGWRQSPAIEYSTTLPSCGHSPPNSPMSCLEISNWARREAILLHGVHSMDYTQWNGGTWSPLVWQLTSPSWSCYLLIRSCQKKGTLENEKCEEHVRKDYQSMRARLACYDINGYIVGVARDRHLWKQHHSLRIGRKDVGVVVTVLAVTVSPLPNSGLVVSEIMRWPCSIADMSYLFDDEALP